MFFLLSKLLEFVLAPLNWIIVMVLMALVYRRDPFRSRRWLVAAATLLILLSNPLLLYFAVRAWEVPAYRTNDLQRTYKVGVLLGGGMNNYDEALDRPMYSQSVDRIMLTMTLYKQGKIEKILISGGSGFVLNRNFSEADRTRELFMMAGIPEEDIIVETRSRNTYENAVESARVLRELGVSDTALLITSAIHIRRALACFHKAGVAVHPFPADRKAGQLVWSPAKIILPDATCLEGWKVLIKEWVGVIVYRFRGMA